MAMLRAYLIEATYDWMVDHSLTPHILVDSDYEEVIVPKDHIDEDGKILLNISQEAVKDIHFNDEQIRFDATFSGHEMQLAIPFEAVLELYAIETQQGLYAREFGYGMSVNEGESDDDVNPPGRPKGGSSLHLV